MKKQKMMFRNLFLLATVIAVFSVMYGCKQPDNGSAGTSEITVTVEKDSHVKEAPKNFKLAKNSVLGFTELKQKIPGLKFKTGYELGKICLEKANGKEITDVSKHKFDKDTVIFIVSKPAGGSDEVKLTELKVDGAAKTIEDIIVLGQTVEEKVSVEVKTSPADAKVSYEPDLESGFWKLAEGKNTLKIIVKKGSKSKVYNANIERISPNFDIPHRKIYGFFLRCKTLGSNFGFGEFYLDSLQDIQDSTLIYKYKQPLGVYAGTCVDNVYYACEYTFSPYGPPIAGDFISYDISSGIKKTIGKYTDNDQFRVQDMTYDYSQKKIYGVGFENGNSALYEFNPQTGSRKNVATLSKKGVGTLAADFDGTLYTIGQDGILYKINKNTGELSPVCETEYKGMLSPQTMEFDHTTGLLYWASNTSSKDMGKDTYMIEFNLKKSPPQVKELGKLGSRCNLLAMYIPFVKDGEEVPSAVSNMTITPDKTGQNKAEISWNNPSTTFGGKPLISISSITIMRNGNLVTTIPVSEIGGKMTYNDDNLPCNGEFKYTLYASNNAGVGEKTHKNAYIGFDAPDKPNDIVVQVGAECKSAVISWTKPIKGVHNGYFTEEGLTYKIVRLPDNTTVVENLTQTSFTDNSITVLKRYTYKVYACNQYGETGAFAPSDYILGAAVLLPVTENFENQEEYFSKWTTVDGNDDNYSWIYNSPYGEYQFGDVVSAAEYIINQGIPNLGKDADEWIITPPINFDKTKTYTVKLNTRAIESDEKIIITIGNSNDKAVHSDVGTITVQHDSAPEEGNTVPMREYKIDLPALTENINCIGFHLVSKYPQKGISYLQIGKITIEEK